MASFDSIGVVIDAGSKYTKVGFAAEAFPRCVFPTVVGRFRRPGLTDGFPDVYCGKEAIQNRGISNLKWPVRESLIQDWDEMEKLWHHSFYKELHVPPEEARVLHAVHPLVPRKDKEKMAEILFESFTVQYLYLAKSPALVLHASGRTSGVVLENGFSCCYSAPIFEGFPLKHSIITSPLNGEVLTNVLKTLLSKSGYSFTTPIERDLLDRIKAELCYVAEDYEVELATPTYSTGNKAQFELPDGQKIFLGEELFLCPEILFQPYLQGFQCTNVTDMISSSIDRCDMDYKALFYENIVLSGGSSMFPGLEKRLFREISVLLKGMEGIKCHVDAMSTRQFATWAGGSIVGSMTTLMDFWMSRSEYEDVGADRVHHKFF